MGRLVRVLAGAALLATSAVACRDGRADTAPSSTTAEAETTTTMAGAPEVIVLDPGAEPRQALRIAYTVGDVVSVDLTVDQRIDQVAAQGQDGAPTTSDDAPPPQRFDSPPITQGLTYTVDEVDDQGRASFTVEITSTGVQAEGTELTAEAALRLEAELQPLVGLTGSGRVDDRGMVDSFAMELPSDLNDDLAAQIDALDGQLRAVGPRLPAEEVGVGARWQISVDATVRGVTFSTTTTYTLTERTEGAIAYAAEIAGTADDQDLAVPGLEATRATLSSASSTGASTGTQSLLGLGFTARTETTTTQTVVTGADGATFDQVIETDLAARATPS